MAKDLWLHAERHLHERRWEQVAILKALNLKTGRTWAIMEHLRALWHDTRLGWACRHWQRWYVRAAHSRLTPVIEAAALIRRHLPTVLTFFANRMTNTVSEGLNSKIQAIKNRL